MTLSRDWATPLTIGAFALMAATGTLMFFHLNNPLQEVVHSWMGWVMVAAVGLHAAANWPGFARHFKSFGRGPVLATAAALVFGVSFAAAPREGGAPVPVIAIQALANAPIAQVAPLFGKSPEAARRALAAAGIALADDATPLARAVGRDRERLGLALRTLAAAPAR